MEQVVLIGRKGGSSEAHQPVEARNNLLSKSYAKVLLAVGEGEFAGVPTGQDIYLDGTPLISATGLENFGGVKWEFRPGTTDQTHIVGMPDISSEYNVGYTLTNEQPYTRLLSNSQLDAFRVTLSWPALYQQKDNGDIVGYNIEYAIDVATDGAAFVEQGRWDTNSGKTNVEYNRTHRINLPKPGSAWTIRVRRITANKNDSKFQDAMQVKTLAEVIDAKLRYPNTALLYVEFDAELFGGTSIPKVSLKTKGRYVQVPSNYDAASRNYNGVWNGTFKWAWSNNPAWIFYDLVVNERFGLGSRIKPSMVDKWTLYQVAQYCDIRVPDGNGGTEPRYTCNIYIQSRKEAWQVLRDIVAIFNGMLYWSGTQMVASADMPVAVNTIRNYSRSNVIEGKFTYSSTSEKTIYTTALVSFDDPSNHYETAVEAVNELSLVQRYKTWAQSEITAIGCTSRGEAQRKGKYTMLTNSLNRLVTFKLGMEGYLPRPGEVIGVADQVLAGSSFAGRISNATTKTVTVDRIPNAVAGDILYVNRADGITGEGRTIQSVNGKVITVTADYSAAPSIELGWYVEKTTLKSQLFRVTKVTWDDDAAEYEVQGAQYEDSKYAAVDTGARLESRPITSIPAGGQEAPTGLTLSSFSFIEQMMAVTTLSVKWNATPGAMNYEGQWRKDGGEWNNVGLTTSTGFDVKGIYSGNYQARVRAINAAGIRSVWAESDNTTLNGKVGAPPTLVNFTTVPELFAIRINWGFQDGAGDGAYIELQEADNIQGANARQLTLATYPALSYLKSGMAAGVVRYFRGRLIDRTGNQSAWTGWTYGISETDADKILDAIAGEVGKSALGQELLSDIELITLDGPGSVNERVNVVKVQVDEVQTALGNQIEGVSTQLTTVKSDLQKQIEAVSKLTDSMPYKANTAYKLGQSVLGADGFIYQALKDVPVNNAPPSAAYWLNVGQVIRDSNGLAARVNTTESKITSIEGVNTSQGTAITGLNNSLTNKADASALQTVATKVTAAEDKITSQGQTLTNLQNTVAGKADASALAGLSNTVTQQGTSLTTASNNIVALSNNLSNAGGENLTYNPDFLKPGADGVADGYLPDAPGTPGASTGVFSLVTSWMNSAEKAQRIAVTGLNVSALYRSIRNSPNRLPKVAEGQASCSSIYVRGTAGLGFRIFIQQINASGGLLTTTPSAMFYLTEATQRIALATPSPVAGCVALVMFYRVYGSDTVSNGYIEMARPQVEYGNVPTGWSNNGQVVVNDQSATSNAVASLTSLVDQQGSALTSTSNNIVTLTNSLKAANSAGDNIVSNATFDPAFDQMGFTVFASTATGVPANCPFKYVAKLSSRDHLPTVSSVPFVATKPGDVWRMSALVACGAGTSPFQLYARKGSDPSTSVSTLQGGASTASTSTWTRATYDLIIPAGTFFFQPFLQIEQAASGGATTWYATDWHVENISAAKAAQTTADAAAGAVSSLNSTVDQQGNAITSMSSNIVNLTNNITTAGGENLLYNPSFEIPHSTVPGMPEGWVVGGPAATIAYSLVDSTYDPGTKAQRVDASGMTTSTYVDLTPRPEYRPGLSPGQIVTFSAYVKGTPGIGFQLFMQHRNTAGSVLATASQGITLLTDGWQRVTLTSAPLPEGTVSTGPLIRLRTNGSGSISAGFMIVDKTQLEIGATVSGWHDNTKALGAAQTATSTALAGLTSTVNQQGSSITSTSQDVVSLNNTISRTGDNNPTRVYESVFSSLGLDTWGPNGANPGSAATATFTNVAGNTSGWTLTLDCTKDLNHWWGDSSRRIKIDPTRLYKLSVRVNQLAKNGRDPATYIGVDVFDQFNRQISVTGVQSLVNSHYFLVAGGKLPENTWTEYVTYVKGFTTGTENGNTGAGTIADPRRIKSGGVYMSPMILTGHPNAGGILAVDYFRIDDVTDQVQIDATASSLQALSNKVTQQGDTLTSTSNSVTSLGNSISTLQGAITASGLDPAPNCLWNFDSTVEGWTVANASLAVGKGFVTITATAGDPNFVSPDGLAVNGALYNKVRAKITRRAGAVTDWDGQMFYSTVGGHGFVGTYLGYAANPNLAIGESTVVEFDMTTRPAAQATDWANGTISRIRLDFGVANASAWEVDWVAIGRSAPAASSRAVQIMESTVTQQGAKLTAQAGQLTQLGAEVNNVAAVLSNETNARASADSSLSQRIDTAQATAGNASAAVQQTSTAVANLDGRVNAQYSVKVMTMSNGMKVAAGFGIGTDSEGGLTQSTFAVTADRFTVLNSSLSGTLFSPFSVEGGQVYISDAFIKKATIQNLLVSADINSSLTTAQGLPVMQVITRDAQIILRHHTRNDTFTLMNRDGMQVYVDNRLRVRMGIWG